MNAESIYQNLGSSIKFNLRFHPREWQKVSAFYLKDRLCFFDVSCRNFVNICWAGFKEALTKLNAFA